LPNRNQLAKPRPDRRKVIFVLVIVSLPLLAILLSLSSFEMRFIDPKTSGQTVSLVALTLLVSLLFGGLTFVLMRLIAHLITLYPASARCKD